MRVPVQCKHGVVKKYCPDCNARLDKIIDFVRNEGKPMTDQVIEVAHSAQELRDMYESSKCCGNCNSIESRSCEHWQTYRETGNYPPAFNYCDKWQYDGLTRAEREIK